AAGEVLAVAPVASRHDAIEHIDSKRDRLNDVFRRAHAHQVTRPLPRHERGDLGDDVEHRALFFADGKPADAVAVESQLDQSLEAALAQVGEETSLIYAKQGLAIIYGAESVPPSFLRILPVRQQPELASLSPLFCQLE